MRKTLSINLVINCVIILFYVSSVSKILQFSWTNEGLFLSTHSLHIFSSPKMLSLILFPLLIASMFYTTVVLPKFESASVGWNSIPSTDSSEFRGVQRTFVALCHIRFLDVCCKHNEGILSNRQGGRVSSS
jgi:hypothetical protein